MSSASPNERTPLVDWKRESDDHHTISLLHHNDASWNLARYKILFGFILGGVFVFLVNTFESPSTSQSTSSQSISTSSMSFAILDDDIESRMDDDNASTEYHLYVATQFISVTINTFGGIAEEGECEGRDVSPIGTCYLGNLNNITDDIYHRLSIVEQILSKLRNDAFQEKRDIDHSDNVLKIVMFPEFFWRGPHGAYSTSEFWNEEGVLTDLVSNKLPALLRHDDFQHYLLVVGTILATRTPDDPREAWQHALSAKEVEYFNLACVLRGGPNGKHFAVAKKYISGADFLSRTHLPNPKDYDVNHYSVIPPEIDDLFAKRGINFIRDNVIELDGLRIGLEICLDHRLEVLWNHIQTQEHHRLVDILLLTSAGMSIDRGPNPIVPGGVVYMTDGGASSAACLRSDDNVVFLPDQVCRGGIGGLKHIPVGAPG
jgi:predicted amidohydrolase